MKYMGSKNRIAKDILPIVLNHRKDEQWYVEPFCGGCNIIDKVTGNRIANDVNSYLIAFAEALSQGWLPDSNINEETYLNIKSNINKYEPRLVGYVGFQLSYGAMWFSSYRKDTIGRRNYSLEAYNNVKKQAEKLKGIKFYNKNYYEIPIPDKSIIYCDPPYEGTIKYKANKDSFDHKAFWEWVRNKSLEGHSVYISEYKAPEDFECIWSTNLSNGMSKNDAVEKLFKYKYSVNVIEQNIFNI
jgi:DNA adenine methylase